jgi:hypothetical protein
MMTEYCEKCGIEHMTKADAERLHMAMQRARKYLRRQVELALEPIERGAMRGKDKPPAWEIRP